MRAPSMDCTGVGTSYNLYSYTSMNQDPTHKHTISSTSTVYTIIALYLVEVSHRALALLLETSMVQVLMYSVQ